MGENPQATVVEEPKTVVEEPKVEGQNNNTEPEVTIESLMAELAQERAARAKDKAALDKVLKENGEVKKQYREVLTEQQKAAMDKAEADEERKQYVADLEAYKQKNEAMKRYVMQGMSGEMATEAAEAEISGDMDKLTDIQKKHTETVLKNAKAEWQKSIPQPQFGTGEYSSMTKEEILAIKDTAQRQEAIARNLHLFR